MEANLGALKSGDIVNIDYHSACGISFSTRFLTVSTKTLNGETSRVLYRLEFSKKKGYYLKEIK